jgi:hypothetical protein
MQIERFLLEEVQLGEVKGEFDSLTVSDRSLYTATISQIMFRMGQWGKKMLSKLYKFFDRLPMSFWSLIWDAKRDQRDNSNRIR